MDVYLVRHAQSESNAGLTTYLDSGLTPLGRRQAELTGERLKHEGITRIFVSPLVRTLQTAEPICRHTGLRATAYPAICEYFSPKYPGYLAFQGLSPTEICRQYPHVAASAEPSYPESDPAESGNFTCDPCWWPDGFETYVAAYERAVRARDHLLGPFARTEERLVIVSHANPIGWLIEAFTRVERDPAGPPWVDNCSITHLCIPPGDRLAPAIVVQFNDSTHLIYDDADAA